MVLAHCLAVIFLNGRHNATKLHKGQMQGNRTKSEPNDSEQKAFTAKAQRREEREDKRENQQKLGCF